MLLSEQTIEDMKASAGLPGRCVVLREGWREPLPSSQGFRHHYDRHLGEGGWEFHQLNAALSIAMIDFCAADRLIRSHRHDDHLVFCAMVEGRSMICAEGGPSGDDLAHGFCTFYGLASGESIRTVYEPNRPLRYVSVFLRRDRAREVLGLDIEALPALFRDYLLHRTPIGLRHVPLDSGAGIAAAQALECPYEGELQRLYLTAKSIEIVCSVIRSHAAAAAPVEPLLRRTDIEKLREAKRLIEANLGEPLSVSELAGAVGMTVKKLQQGFQSCFRSSVGQAYKRVRLAKAMALVSGSDMSMIDIAIECGYECPGSFTRAFKLAFGSNPTAHRTGALASARREPLRQRRTVPRTRDAALMN